jgi:hypothetical protein
MNNFIIKVNVAYSNGVPLFTDKEFAADAVITEGREDSNISVLSLRFAGKNKIIEALHNALHSGLTELVIENVQL